MVEGLDQPARLQLLAPEHRRHHRDAGAGKGRIGLHHLIVEDKAGIRRRSPDPSTPMSLQPVPPPIVARAEPGQVEQLLGPGEILLGGEFGAADRAEVHAEQEMAAEARPVAPPDPDRGVEFAGREIDQPVVGGEADGEIGMADLEAAEPRREPGRRHGLGRAERQHRLILGDEAGKGVLQRLEGIGDQRRDPAPGLGQLHPPLHPREQGRAEPLLEDADLVGDRRLGHPQFARGLGEILMARGRLEDADGAERGQSGHGSRS